MGLHVVLMVLLWQCCFNGMVEAGHKVSLLYQSFEPARVNTEHMTGYHFQPPKNWINGPMYYNGVYHLFYQYNPKGAVWGNIVWAHSVSPDLINWKALPPAIFPSKPFDVNGCWSGSATILPGSKPVIIYTGVDGDNRQVQNIAFPKNTSDPNLTEWTKPDYNPVIVPDQRINATRFRDPSTAWFGPDNHWRLVIGSARKRRGIAVMYRSLDFKKWIKAKHPLHSAPETGMWECPDFFPVASGGEKNGLDTSVIGKGVKHVFKVSLDLNKLDYYTVGRYYVDPDRYVPENSSADNLTGLRFDYGNFYASKTFFDAKKKRRILWGWSKESESEENGVAKGWAGIQTIPRALWLSEDGKQVVQWPSEELDSLRKKQVQAQDVHLKSGGLFEVEGIQSAEADVEVTFKLPKVRKAEPFDPKWTDPQKLCCQKPAVVKGGLGPFGLLVLASSDLSEQTAVFFRVFRAQGRHVVLMCHDPSRSTRRLGVLKPAYGSFVDIDIAKEWKISLRTLIDNSVVESFGAEGRTCITSRVYPVLSIGRLAHLYAFNNGTTDVKISQLQAWEMRRPMMNERELNP